MDDGSSSISISFEGPSVTEDRQCFVCGFLFPSSSDEEERNRHVNSCLDGRPPEDCWVCGTKISHLSEYRRNAHMDRCCENAEKKGEKTPLKAVGEAVRMGENRMDGRTYQCVVCAKDLSNASHVARASHVKNCAKRNSVEPAEMRSLIRGMEDGSIVDAPAAPVVPLPSPANVYRDPISGFTRTIPASAGSDRKKKKSKAKNKKRDPESDFVVLGDDDEVAQIGLALVESLGGSLSGSLGENSMEKEVVVPSLQGSNKGKDLAGFEITSLTQVVASVAPPKKANMGEPVAAPTMPTSRLGGGGVKRSSLWRKASERPSSVGEKLPSERADDEEEEKDRTVVPLAPKVVETLDNRNDGNGVDDEDDEDEDDGKVVGRAQGKTTGAVSTVVSDMLPSLSVARHRNCLEIPEDRMEEIQHALQNISNAYAQACRKALTVAEQAVEDARRAYFSAIGHCAVERDQAIRAVLQRHQLHEGHASALPMMSYAALEFPAPSDLVLPPDPGIPEIMAMEEDEDNMHLLADALEQEAQQQVVFGEKDAGPSPSKKLRKGKEEWNESTPPSVIVQQRVTSDASEPIEYNEGLGYNDYEYDDGVLHSDAAPFPLPNQSPSQTPSFSPVLARRPSDGLSGVVSELNLDTPFSRAGIRSPEKTPLLPDQPPDFNAMDADELKQRLLAFGLNGGSEKFMRSKLLEIWMYQHKKQVTESLRKAATAQQQHVGMLDEESITPVRPSAKKAAFSVAGPVVAVEQGTQVPVPVSSGSRSPPLSQSGNPEHAIVAYIRSSTYFERMLMYEPIPLLQLQEDLRAAGIKMSKEALRGFLDSKGLVFHDPESKWH